MVKTVGKTNFYYEGSLSLEVWGVDRWKPSIKEYSAIIRTCNCSDPTAFPLGQKCLTPNIVYKCNVISPASNKAYIGICSTPFKTRFNNHKHTFNNILRRKSTTLSDFVWSLKESSTQYQLKWSILAKAQPYSGGLRDCNLCTEETLRILFAKYPLLNKRSELVTACRHKTLLSFSHYQPSRPPQPSSSTQPVVQQLSSRLPPRPPQPPP